MRSFGTKEEFAQRRRELMVKDIAGIRARHLPKMAAWIIQKKYGIDCDYIPGQDDGAPPASFVNTPGSGYEWINKGRAA